ncbi:SDR family NAD(P)-dependent oxidoreductase [Actinoalloteichus hymeniacidonis]|uniref:Short-chain alcohol dehydrogenase n=1 Tax=Actinoalloteichus hymeniacidonis TaxID=340345 RepID=A0AAC9HMT7_9PSEU|nr:SDR family oxidoreductase [Actinoalloteichus hymeniacidonis]AOS62081.1 short-chain dehydrogenase of unknown substrate specificity [Actinoalloteichus hymeniacidonis]MBB5909897.1 hypothetical protein [Actinoalloteichus hymeniacidonis]
MTAVDYRNQTTLITGASSGIGVEFARQLAGRGSNVVLVARRKDRLEALATELTSAHDIRATVLPLDLSKPAAGRQLAEQVDQLDLDITSLIGNAGFATSGPFHTEDPARIGEQINVNIANLVDINLAFIGRLRAARRGVLVNVASVAGYQPIPYMAVYAATKAFVLSFTEALWAESRKLGPRVLCLSPGATRTEFFDVSGTHDMVASAPLQTPREVVASGLRALDRRNPPPSTVSGRRNRLITAVGPRLLSRRRTLSVAASIAQQR